MFDVSFAEIALIAVIALLVLGPERLPRAAKMVGLWIRKAKASWYSVKSEFERELADEELKRSLQQASKEVRDARKAFDEITREPISGSRTAPPPRDDRPALEQPAPPTAPEAGAASPAGGPVAESTAGREAAAGSPLTEQIQSSPQAPQGPEASSDVAGPDDGGDRR